MKPVNLINAFNEIENFKNDETAEQRQFVYYFCYHHSMAPLLLFVQEWPAWMEAK